MADETARDDGPLRFLLLGTGGSSGKTLAAIEDGLRAIEPGARFAFVDTQPFNLRTPGSRTAYPGAGDVTMLTPQECGIGRRTGSQTLNLLLSGGPLAYRRLVRRASAAFRPLPDLVVTCHDRMYAETAVLNAARAQGVATVLVQEGPFCAVGGTRPRAARLRLKAGLAPLAVRLGLVPPIPAYGEFGHTRILAASGRYAGAWEQAGLAPEGIEVTGIPRFDEIAAARKGQAARLDDGGPPRLLYLEQPFAAHGKVEAGAARAALELLARGLGLARRELAFELTVRVHPRSDGAALALLRDMLDFAPVVDTGERPIAAALAQGHVAIGHYSTGLLESLLLGTPSIVIPIAPAAFAEASEAAKQAWLETTGVPVCREPGDVAVALQALRGGDPLAGVRWDVIEEETGPVDGGATARVAAALLRLASQARRQRGRGAGAIGS